MTSSDEDRSRRLHQILTLTAEQHRIKRRIDLLRARVDADARTQFDTTGVAPTWKLPKLGQVRLDGIDPDPRPVVLDQAAFTSWLAQEHPTEVAATIEVPADRLDAALELLGFGEVPVLQATVTPRTAGVDAILKRVQLNEVTGDGDTGRSWVAADPESGQIVDGVGGRIASEPRLVVAVDPKVKAEYVEAADLEDATLEDTDAAGEPAAAEGVA